MIDFSVIYAIQHSRKSRYQSRIRRIVVFEELMLKHTANTENLQRLVVVFDLNARSIELMRVMLRQRL
jgi:hypothetical protein